MKSSVEVRLNSKAMRDVDWWGGIRRAGCLSMGSVARYSMWGVRVEVEEGSEFDGRWQG